MILSIFCSMKRDDTVNNNKFSFVFFNRLAKVSYQGL
jgi:hypothetical protein